jgi:hydroxyacylglutathione hydrolase
MLFRRFYDEALAQASYLIGCQATGDAFVIDPNRDADQYLATAEAERMRIIGVAETHIHADFLSGTRELAERSGARMYLSDAGPPEWRYGFRENPRVVSLMGGERIPVGSIVLEPLHTPGHTPEHLSFFVTDGAASSDPMGVLTGDFVFVGDVGRPDLLEKAVRVVGSADAAARVLFTSLQGFKSLPDHLQVWPAHGAGSACGKGIGAVPQSTVGYEKRVNWAFGIDEENAFVRQVLEGQPEPPRYFAVMKRLNRDGPPILGRLPAPERIGENRLPALLADGAVIVDTRSAAAFAAGHIPGTINLPLNRSLATYAGALLPYDRDIYLIIGGSGRGLEEAMRQLTFIGLDRVAGYVGPEAVTMWASDQGALGVVPQLDPREFARDRGGACLLDVRGLSEWSGGHIDGAILIPLPELLERIDEVPTGQRIVVQCQTGSRSAIAASVLLASGRRQVANLTGGFSAWAGAGLPVKA